MKSLKFLLIGATVIGVMFYLLSDKKTTLTKQLPDEKNNSIESIENKKIPKKERMKTPDELYEEQIKQTDKQQATATIAPIDRDIIPLELEELEKQAQKTSKHIEVDREIIPFELEALEEEPPANGDSIIDDNIIPKELVELEKNSSSHKEIEDASVIDELVPESFKTIEEYGDNGTLPETDEIPN